MHEIKHKLQQLRRKLIDLSGRNQLIKCNLAAKTSYHIDIIDRSLDDLWVQLTSEENDDLLLQFLPSPSENEKPISLEAIAKKQGLNPDVELSIKSEKKNRCNKVWTLLSHERFRKSVSKIYETARLASEEKGISSLHCVLGFLEWTEAEHSDILLTSPLILVPIHMGNFNATAQQTGVQFRGNTSEGKTSCVNPALLLKLNQDYKLHLPQWEENETPSSYIAKVKELVAIHPKWRIVPRIIIRNFAFPRLALYEDLDEIKWTHEQSNELIDHSVISTLLGGFDRETNEENQEDDEIIVGKPIEGVVFNSDSSQLEAIHRVSLGESLVIEGPPGTGKSQTIANIITTALAKGKSVLFVADKKAAIDVVEKRLEKVGLGTYCLNLHDASLGKNHMYDRIEERLNISKPRSRSHPQLGENHLNERLLEISKELNKHFEDLANTYDPSTIPTHEVLWDSISCRSHYLELQESLRKVNISSPLSISIRQKDEIVEQLQLLEQLALVIDPAHKGLSQHPLFGIKLYEASFERRENIENIVANILTKLSNLISQFDFLSNHGFNCKSISDVNELSVWAELYGPKSDYALHNELITCQDLHNLQSSLALFARSYPQKVQVVLNQENKKKQQDLINHLLDHSKSIEESNLVRSEILEKLATIKKINESLTALRSVLGSVCPILFTSERPLSWINLLKDYSDLVKCFQETSSAVRECMQPALWQSSREHWTMRYEQTKEAKRIEEALRPILETSPETIERLFSILHKPSIWCFMTSSWWSARRELIQLIDPKEELQQSDRLARLTTLQQYRQLVQEIRSDMGLKSLIDTCIDPYEAGFSNIFEALKLQEVLDQKSTLWQVICKQSNLTAENFLQQTVSALGIEASNNLLSLARHFENHSGLDLEAIENKSQKEEETFSQILYLLEELELGSFTSKMDLCSLSSIIESLDHLLPNTEVLRNRTIAEIINGLNLYTKALPKVYVKAFYSFLQIMHQNNLHLRKEVCKGISSTIHDLASFGLAWKELIECLSLDENAFLGQKIASTTLLSVASKVKSLNDSMSELSEWIRMQRCLTKLQASECPVKDLVDTYVTGNLSMQGISKVFSILFSQSQAKELFKLHKIHSLDGDNLQTLRQRFLREDATWREASISYVKKNLNSKSIPSGCSQGPLKNWTDLALIRHELHKQKRRISERQLIARSHSALMALMPCFMMSPLTVAQYLSPSGPKFDLVLIDEASQMRPEEAMSSIARGKQLVVVGDSQQLPPTNFLEAIIDDEEVSDEDAVDNESILDMAKVKFNAHSLKWHYRSRHESLIHFSNQMFYRGRLIVCPSPLQKSSLSGIHLICSEGIYKDSMNDLEAQHIVEKAAEILKLYPEISIGMVAMNRQQSELISSKLYEMRCRDPQVNTAMDRWEKRLERCFVKNLENVQGDERDVILISTVYGPHDQGASVMRRFGPINSSTGHRRLNVLFTRARNAMYVFTSLKSSDVCHPDIAKPSRGAEALAQFLDFAGSGILAASTDRFKRSDPDNPFELYVGQLLENAGYQVEYQVGQLGFYIDIGVKHPSFPFGYIAGIECDGAPYHSSISARDRDKLRQEILENHGWHIYRIWSTDWFHDPQNEGKKLVKWLQHRQSTLKC